MHGLDAAPGFGALPGPGVVPEHEHPSPRSLRAVDAVPEADPVVHAAQQATVQVDFNDLETQYVKVNIPGGMFVKWGQTAVDIKVNETTGDGGTYADRTTEGDSIGLGYQGTVGDSGLGFRIETNYVTFDNVTTDNGVAASAGTVANGGRNEITIENMEGVTAMFALTYTLGRN